MNQMPALLSIITFLPLIDAITDVVAADPRSFVAPLLKRIAEGELTEREKSLIALAVAHAVQCPYCIDAYTRACLDKGSNLAEMTEAHH